MIIDPVQYTALVQQVRTLKALNQMLTYENKAFLNQYMAEKQQKEKVIKEFAEFRQKMLSQQQQTLQNCKEQTMKITEELQKKKLQETAFFQKQVVELQKGAFQKMKSLILQYKDHRLKSHLNDEFVNRLLKLYPGDNNPGLPEFYLWVKKLITPKKPAQEQLSIIMESEKENSRTSMKGLGKSSIKSILKKSSKKSLFPVANKD